MTVAIKRLGVANCQFNDSYFPFLKYRFPLIMADGFRTVIFEHSKIACFDSTLHNDAKVSHLISTDRVSGESRSIGRVRASVYTIFYTLLEMYGS